MIILSTTYGDIEIELNMEKAPVSSKKTSYVTARRGSMKGQFFHRVIDGFMIQAGGHTEDMTEKETHAPIANEANRGLKNKTGTIAFARTDAPHSATAQFFYQSRRQRFS
ncbi:peptidylprolyl isomerase [Vibrio sinaloensis]|nr:peptidylprolyl isomerase [Vibrio sinaloensis]